MERKVGEVFEYEGRYLRVAVEGDCCEGCFFGRPNVACRIKEHAEIRDRVGECCRDFRDDATNVVFRLVEPKKEVPESQAAISSYRSKIEGGFDGIFSTPLINTQGVELDSLGNPKKDDQQKEEGSRVNHPKHYNSHPSGVECIEIVRHHDFDTGNAIKYLWRSGLKGEEGMSDIDKEIEDLEKAVFYIQDKIKTLKKTKEDTNESK